MKPVEDLTGIQVVPATNNDSRTSLIGNGNSNKPIGIRLFGSCFKFSSIQDKRTYHKGLVLTLTFIAYAAFHMGRRPLSIVKNVLNRNCSNLPDHLSNDGQPSNHLATNNPSTDFIEFSANQSTSYDTSTQTIDNSCNWAPFDDNATANQLLAILDSSFLLSYAIFMFISGVMAERMNLRYFISIGSLLSGIGLIAFGLAYPFQIHSMTYFVVVQVLSGAFQTTGWPAAVTCVSNWFEPKKRGLIFGLWNSHTNLGNILGATIAGFFVEKDWGLSFMVPGVIMIVVGFILFLFLVPKPIDINLPKEENKEQPGLKSERSASSLSSYDSYSQTEKTLESSGESSKTNPNQEAVSFMTALKIPGVIEYSFCLFFSKLVSYTFLYWLPRYISSSTLNGSEDSAYLSTPFDIGGIAGAIIAGYLSDKYNASGLTCNFMLLTAIPTMFLYQKYGALSDTHNILLQLLVGSLVNGPYCLITTAVSADLGDRVKDGRAMATVAAIIDGMGSIGAVLGPLFAGFVSNSGNWRAVFMMLMLADVFAALCLVRVSIQEIRAKFYGPTESSDTRVDEPRQ